MSSTAAGIWIQFQSPSPINVSSYAIAFHPNGSFKVYDWIVVGSNNGTTWVLIDSVTNFPGINVNGLSVGLWTSFNALNPGSYTYFRLVIMRVDGGNFNRFEGFGISNGTQYYPPTLSSSTDKGYTLTTSSDAYGWSRIADIPFVSMSWASEVDSVSWNSIGTYTGSTRTTYYIPQPTPSAPESLSAVGGDQIVTVSFTPGSNNITNYKYSINDGTSYVECDPAVTSSPIVIAGLTNGQSYNIKIRAVNSFGDGTPSNTIAATPHTVPDAPSNLVASYNGSGSVSISFTPGSDGGETISNYQYSIDCGATFTPLDPIDGISPVTISGLTNGQTYCIELKAVNSAAGVASSSVEYTASGLPDVPTSLTWEDYYNGTILVSFTPGFNQGSAITNYQYSLDHGDTYTTFNPPQTGSSVFITGLTHRTQYNIELKAVNANGASTTSAPLALYYMCFLEGTKILCYDPESKQEIERPIESLRSGDLVKTTMDGYKAIDTIGTSKIYNPANSMRSKNRLYKYSKENHPELKEDLVITGCHAVLVSELSDEERRDLIDIQGKVYVTADYYRLIACVDKRSQPYEKEGLFNIWHLALENDNYYFNYGIYANGLKVETASKRMMKEMSGMDLIQ
jgi:hypothetical protein